MYEKVLQDHGNIFPTTECEFYTWGELEAGLPKQLANFGAKQIHIQKVIQGMMYNEHQRNRIDASLNYA